MLAPALRREREAVIGSFVAASEAMQATDAAIAADADIEALHDFRVALRRVRTLLSSLRGELPLQDLPTLREECAWLAARTGVLRDLDVLLTSLPDYLADIPDVDQQTAAALTAELRRRRATQRRGLLRSFRTARSHRLVARLEALGDMEVTDPNWSVQQFAGRVLWRTYRRVHRLGQSINGATAPELLHELRKRCKRLRYLLDTFSGLYPHHLVGPTTRGLRRLQNVLGRYQDCSTHVAILEAMRPDLADTGPQSVGRRELINELLTVLQRRMRRDRGRLRRRFARFVDEQGHQARRRAWRRAARRQSRQFGTRGYCHGWLDGRDVGLPPGKVVCIGRNYAEHAAELNNPVPDRPLLFIKPPSALVDLAPGFQTPPGRGEVHHELEIALLVTRQPGKGRELLDCIGGIGLALDLTLREEQAQLKAKGQPWERAKGFDGACPVSPFVPVTPEELCGEPLALSLHVNGSERQRGDSSQMLFPIACLLEEIASNFSLWPGDVVLTGTPAGVGPLVPGDEVEAQLAEVLTVKATVWPG